MPSTRNWVIISVAIIAAITLSVFLMSYYSQPSHVTEGKGIVWVPSKERLKEIMDMTNSLKPSDGKKPSGPEKDAMIDKIADEITTSNGSPELGVHFPPDYTCGELAKLVKKLADYLDKEDIDSLEKGIRNTILAATITVGIVAIAEKKEVHASFMKLTVGGKRVKADDPLVMKIMIIMMGMTMLLESEGSLKGKLPSAAELKTMVNGFDKVNLPGLPGPPGPLGPGGIPPTARYQSCGEGGCGCGSGCGSGSGFRPFAGIPGLGKGHLMSYIPASIPISPSPEHSETDLSDELLAFHNKDRRSLASYHPTSIREPRSIRTFSHYYADLPTPSRRSLYTPDPTDELLRPAPPVMRIHKMGPYADMPTFIRPSQGIQPVLETYD